MGPLDPSYFFGGLAQLARVIRLVSYMDTLSPVDTADEWAVQTRWDLAYGIAKATPWKDEQALLVTIARWETVFEPRWVYCLGVSTVGASGPFQVIPRSKEEKILLCNDMKLSARLALQRVDESRRICRHLPKKERLAQYTTGKCDALGRKMSKMRWSSNGQLVAALTKCCTSR